jgi:hypothetical protein
MVARAAWGVASGNVLYAPRGRSRARKNFAGRNAGGRGVEDSRAAFMRARGSHPPPPLSSFFERRAAGPYPTLTRSFDLTLMFAGVPRRARHASLEPVVWVELER